MATFKDSASRDEHDHAASRAWVVTVNMGYGHQRAAYPLRDLADGRFITANDYEGMPASDKRLWQESRKVYEELSRISRVPLIGKALFGLLDRWQEIPPFYPRRDLSAPTFQVRQTYKLFEHGFLRHLVSLFEKDRLPVVCTFYLPALAAEYFGYRGDIYLQICDTDVARLWAPLIPRKTRITYLAPNRRVVERLKQYGVPEKKILLTGFPLPKELIGGLDHAVLKRNLATRIVNLDPAKTYTNLYGQSVRALLGTATLPRPRRPLTLVFAVGGAGAQWQMSVDILRSLKEHLEGRELRFVLVAGVRPEVRDHFLEVVRRLGMENLPHSTLHVLYAETLPEYFSQFNALLQTTDVLWTKPSELSFFASLGIPIIIAPPIGSQEKQNAHWLRTLGAGIPQEDPRYVDQWLWDWLRSGWLARAAVAGMTGGVKRGTYRIEEIIAHQMPVLSEPIEPL